jgi:isopentenyl-diphosphate delta-isomerase
MPRSALKLKALPDEVVSSDREELILVDADDREIGHRSKAACHDRGGLLHRAFSLFVFNPRGELLLQRRAADKRLWPMYWSNSCCSHPRRGETMDEAVNRRLYQELRIRCDLSYLYKFEYHACFGEAGSEHELCWVYAGCSDDRVRANRNEIAAWRFVGADALDTELQARPDRFTPWFQLEWPVVRARMADLGLPVAAPLPQFEQA